MKSPPASAASALGPAASAAATAILAAAGARAVALAAQDAAVVRAVGVGGTGVFRALDAVVAAPLLLVPIGTRALRAGLASALVAAAAAAIAVVVLRALVIAVVPAVVARLAGTRTAPPVSPRLLGAVAVAAVLTATLGPTWQAEASAPGGAVLGALFVVAALASAGASSLGGVALALGLAASYEPLAFVSAVAAVAPFAFDLRPKDRGAALDALAAFALGLVPLGLGLALGRRDPAIALAGPALSWSEPHGVVPAPIAFVKDEVGIVLLVAGVAGAALAGAIRAARRTVIALGLAIGVGAIALVLHAGGAAVLVAVLALHLLAGVTLAAVVVGIARARVPFAQASAALVVVLEMVLPVRAADESLTRREASFPRAASWWSEVAWGPAPPAAIVLAPTPGVLRRIAAARAIGEMRGDLVVVPAFDLRTRLGDRALADEPKLAPLYRDVALGSPPEELSFAQLAEQRAVLASFDPRWDRSLARHLVPTGLVSRFETEPRGIGDRRRALEAFGPAKDRLVRVAVARKDADLAAATATLLRARAIAMAATGDREVLSRALDDLRPFAPEDPVASVLVRRIVTTKGPIEVHDLAP